MERFRTDRRCDRLVAPLRQACDPDLRTIVGMLQRRPKTDPIPALFQIHFVALTDHRRRRDSDPPEGPQGHWRGCVRLAGDAQRVSQSALARVAVVAAHWARGNWNDQLLDDEGRRAATCHGATRPTFRHHRDVSEAGVPRRRAPRRPCPGRREDLASARPRRSSHATSARGRAASAAPRGRGTVAPWRAPLKRGALRLIQSGRSL